MEDYQDCCKMVSEYKAAHKKSKEILEIVLREGRVQEGPITPLDRARYQAALDSIKLKERKLEDALAKLLMMEIMVGEKND